MPNPPRRRPPTIDLEATEIVSAPAANAELHRPPTPPPPVQPEPEMPHDHEREQPQAEPPGASDLNAEPRPPDVKGADVDTPPEPPRGNGGVRPAVVVAAGIAGASIAAVAGAVLWGAGLMPPSVRLANTEAVAPLATRIAALDHRIEELSARPVPASRSEVEEVQARLTKLEAAPAAASEQQVGTIEARLEKLEAAAAGPAPPQLRDVETRLAKLEAAAAPPAAADRDAADRVAALDRRVDEALTTARGAASRADAAEKAAAAGAGDAESAVTKVRNGVDALAARLDALEGSVTAIERRLVKFENVTAGDRAVRLGLAAIELRMAVERGVPFAAELAAVKELAPDQALVAPLEPLAQIGVPGAAALARDLSKLGPAVLKAAGPADHDGGVLARFEASASRLVRIRPIDEAPGDDPGTVFARAEVDATHGDIAGAVAEIDRLPENVRAAAAGWVKAAQARIAALDAARRLSASALGALGKPAQ